MEGIKYLDKVKVYPGCKYQIRNKYGKNKYFRSLERAIHYACPRGDFVEIYIWNNAASDIRPNINCTVRDSKDILSEYARTRLIILNKEKTRIIFEYFWLRDFKGNWENDYEYDYDILYNDSFEFFKENTFVTCDMYPFHNRVFPVWWDMSRVLGHENIWEMKKDDVLNLVYDREYDNLKVIYNHEEFNTQDRDIPVFMIKPANISNIRIKEFAFPKDILNDLKNWNGSFVSNGKVFSQKFIKNKIYLCGGHYCLVSDDEEYIINPRLGCITIKDKKTDNSLCIAYTEEDKGDIIHLIPYYYQYEKIE